MQNKNIFIAMSGGLDSSTLMHQLYQINKIYAVFFDYNQKHKNKEYESYLKITKEYPLLKLKTIKIDLSFLTESSLINKNLALTDGIEDKLPNSFVAGRNILFLTYLASYGFNEVKDDIYIALANHKDDFNGYPDCRADTIESLEKTLSLGLDRKVNIIAPFTDYSKSMIAKLSTDFIIKNSWSCYQGNNIPCDTCKSCILRNEAIKNRSK